MEIKIRKTSELLEHAAAYNPRRISDAELRKLEKSIAKHGVVLPILVNRTTGNIVGGHQRLRAAGNLGLEEVPTIEIEVTPAQERILNIALNKIKGSFDAEKLDALLRQITADGLDAEAAGFDTTEIQNLAAYLASGDGGQSDFETIRVKVYKQDRSAVYEAIRLAKQKGAFTEYEGENKNSNGNAITRIAENFLKAHGQTT